MMGFKQTVSSYIAISAFVFELANARSLVPQTVVQYYGIGEKLIKHVQGSFFANVTF